MTVRDFTAPDSVDRLQKRGLIVAIFGIAVCIVGLIKSPDQFFHAYLFAFLFILGLSLGSLGLLMLHHMTSGYWGIIIRRPLEAASRTLVLVAFLFLPIILGMKHIYSIWLNAPAAGEGALPHFQQHYLTAFWFTVRAVVYFAVWLALALSLNRWSKRQDIDKQDRLLRRHLKLVSGPGIVLYVFGIGFASIDWVMSLSPHWFSTIYGFIFVAGQMISSMCLAIVVIALVSKSEPMNEIVIPRYFSDLGKLLLAFLMLWAYFSFSQLLIIWSGNQPDEISFFRSRWFGGFGTIGVILIVFHFFVPFFLLLSRDLKRNFSMLPKVAIWLLLMRLVDLFWYTRPEFTTQAMPNLWDFAAVLGLGGLWLYVFAGQLKRMPLLPLGETKLAEVIAHHE